MNLMKRVGTPYTARGNARKRIVQLRSGVSTRGRNLSTRLNNWWHTPWIDHTDLGLDDF